MFGKWKFGSRRGVAGGITILLLLWVVDSFASEPASLGRVGILNNMNGELTHFHFGATIFGNERKQYSLPGGRLSDYINEKLKQRLSVLGYEAVVISTPEPKDRAPASIIEKGWRNYRLRKSGRRVIESLIVSEKLDFVVVIEDAVRSDQLIFSEHAVYGHGLYTKAYAAKLFGFFIGGVVRGADLEFLGTSAPPYTTDSDFKLLDEAALLKVEPTFRGFADQLIDGLVMYLDGTFK